MANENSSPDITEFIGADAPKELIKAIEKESK